MRPYEWILIAYFLYLGALAFRPGTRPSSRALAAGAALVLCLIVLFVAWSEGQRFQIAHDWAPSAYILFAYWLPGILVVSLDQDFERTLVQFDRGWLEPSLLAAFRRAPRFLVEGLEGAYLCCYPMLPAGYAVLVQAGLAGETARYWTAVIVAAVASYSLLPWLPTRPPRFLEPPVAPPALLGTFNTAILDRASLRLNTFPSGHVATSLAAALSVAVPLPRAGLMLTILAIAIALASVVRRYHYGLDVLAGILVALIAFAVSRLV